ncbi:MAG: bifunctional diguanylate cyclase/phosphodiesterase [Proteocatella sp.]
MKKTNSIGKKVGIVIIISLLLPYIVGSLFIRSTMTEWIYNDNISKNKMMLTQISKLVDDSILKNISGLAEMISLDDRILNSTKNLRIYTDIEDNLSNYDLETISSNEAEVLNYLEEVVSSQDNIAFISIGTEYGGYTEYPKLNIVENYDPRERPWYKNALENNGVSISEPYISKITNELTVTISKKIEKDGKVLGAVGISMNLDSLMENINELKYGNSGHIEIWSPNNLFINSPKNKAWITKNVIDIVPEYKQILENKGVEFKEIKINGNYKLVNIYQSEYSNWKYISVIDKREVLSKVRDIVSALTVVYLIATIIALLLLIFFSRRMTGAIVAILEAINNMATFNFKDYRAKNLDRSSLRRDEIGQIANSLNNMQANFLELSRSISDMDMQIRKIDVSEAEEYRLTLSKSNLFSDMSGAINELLEKMYNYKKEINFMAQNDPMTNLPNRRAFNDKLTKILADDNSEGAVILIDIDDFKGINDTLGHLFGDEVLKEVSNRLKVFWAENTFISRFGGDEFLILYKCKESFDEIINFILNVFVVMDEELNIYENKLKIEFSMGIAVFPRDSRNMDEIIRYADLAMYTVKNKGKNNYAFFNSKMADDLNRKLEIKDILLEAIEKEAFKVLYQPQVEINTGEIVGYEGLIRLREHNIPADVFIGVAEENGLIIPIGRIVTKLIVEQVATWKEKGFSLKPVSINFSAMQIHDSDYKSYLMGLLSENNVEPEFIVIEITEGVFLEHKASTIYLLNELRSKGIKIAVDDFGTGYSSLSYITSLPVDTIKFDRMLSLRFLEHEDTGVIKSLVSLAHSLNLKVVAEGIEDEPQVSKLRDANCDIIQGYYYSKPLESYDVEKNYYVTYKKYD